MISQGYKGTKWIKSKLGTIIWGDMNWNLIYSKYPWRSFQPSFSFCKEKTEIDTTATFGSMSTDKNLHRVEARLV